jgi:transposase
MEPVNATLVLSGVGAVWLAGLALFVVNWRVLTRGLDQAIGPPEAMAPIEVGEPLWPAPLACSSLEVVTVGKHSMHRVRLSAEQRYALNRLAHTPGVGPRTRDRLEMVRLADAGWKVSKIAAHLQISEGRVRYWIRQYLAGGFDALVDATPMGRASGLSAGPGGRNPLFVRPLTEAEQKQLRAGLRSSQAPALRRCQILLASARGERASEIARALGCDDETVRNVIRAFNERSSSAS